MSRSNATLIHAGHVYFERLVDAFAIPCTPVAQILTLDHEVESLADYMEKDPDNQYLGQAIYSCVCERAQLIKEYGA